MVESCSLARPRPIDDRRASQPEATYAHLASSIAVVAAAAAAAAADGMMASLRALSDSRAMIRHTSARSG